MGGSAAPTPDCDTELLSPSPFRIVRTPRRVPLTAPAVTAVHGLSWMSELTTMCSTAEAKLATGGKELSRPSSSNSSDPPASSAKSKFHEGDLYLCAGSLEALEGAIGGVCEAVDNVFSSATCKRCFVCIRPPGHHCSSDMPSGFCWLNNVHVGISHAAISHGLTHAAIIDFDLHHGDGSQMITWAHNNKISSLSKNTPMTKKRPIGYFSLHDINSYPCEMGDDDKVRNASLCIENAHGQSIWNVHLQPWKSEAQFWDLYETKYLTIIEKARSFLRNHSDRLRQHPTHPHPKAAIFLSAGFDASEWESPHMQRHQVNVPTAFYERLTRDIVSMASEPDLGVDGRIISVLEGGYSDRALTSGVLSHVCGLVNAGTPKASQADSILIAEQESVATIPITTKYVGRRGLAGVETVDPQWWDLHHLEILEETLSPKVNVEVPKKRRSDVKPTYTTATESYKAKIVSPVPGRRSLSGSILNSSIVPTEPRVPTPPTPEVDWATAAVELGRLLVPGDRETYSHRPEELNAEATRARRDRLPDKSPSAESMATEPSRMHLRDKRSKATPSGVDQNTRLPSRTSRRRTIADVKTLSSDGIDMSAPGHAVEAEQKSRITRRRSSAASSIISTVSDADYLSTTSLNPHSYEEQAVQTRGELLVRPRAEGPKTKMAKRPPASRKTSVSLVSSRIPEENSTSRDAAKGSISSIAEDRPEKQDFDQLASSMKKMSIKLNVPSREEHDARRKTKDPTRVKVESGVAEHKPAKPSIPAKNRTKTTSPSKPKGKATQASQVLIKGEKDLHARVIEPQRDSSSQDKAQHKATQNRISESPNFLSHQTSLNARQEGTDATLTNNFEAPDAEQSGYSDESAQSSRISAVPEPMQGHPGAPSTIQRIKQDLPIFTSTSPIHFAAQVPDRGAHTSYADPLTANEQITPGPLGSRSTNEHIKSMDPSREGKTFTHSMESGPTIWDVPDTPQPRKSG